MEPALGRRLFRTALTLWVAPPALVLVWAWGEPSWARPYFPVRRDDGRRPRGRRPRGQPPAGLRHSAGAASRRRDLRAARAGDLRRRPRARRSGPARRVQPGERQRQRHRRADGRSGLALQPDRGEPERAAHRRLRARPVARARVRVARAARRPRAGGHRRDPVPRRLPPARLPRDGHRLREHVVAGRWPRDRIGDCRGALLPRPAAARVRLQAASGVACAVASVPVRGARDHRRTGGSSVSSATAPLCAPRASPGSSGWPSSRGGCCASRAKETSDRLGSLARRAWPSSFTSTSTPSTRSWTGPAGFRSSPPAPPSWRCRPSRSPTTGASRARSSSTRRPAKHGVKPLLGCEVYVAEDRPAQKKGYAHLTLLAETNEGYANLIKLASAGFLEGYYYKPRVDWDLLGSHSKGLIALSGCLSGRVCKALESGNRPEAEAEVTRLVQTSSGRTPSTSRSRTPASRCRRASTPRSPSLAKSSGLPLVATGDVHYLRHEDARAHEALLCIQSGDTLDNPNHWKFDTDQFYFKSPAEMAQDFADYPEARRDARSRSPSAATSRSSSGGIHLPNFPVPGRAATPSTTSSSSAKKACKSATER